SGISRQNRVIDRHPSVPRAYWRTYDFRSDGGSGNVFKHPLGPATTDHPFPDFAFVPDGGEILFTLPNGLQGYLLVNAEGRRIDEAPIEIVSDSLKTAGTPTVVNGVSCMACHKQGINRFKDQLRQDMAVSGEARAKVETLIPKAAEWEKLQAGDE